MSKDLGTFDWLPIIILIILLGSTLIIFKIYNDYLFEKHYDLFDKDTDLSKIEIEQRLKIYGQILESGRAFIEVLDEPTRSDWTLFVESQNIQENYPGIQGVGTVKHTFDENEFLKDMKELREQNLLNREIPVRSYDGAYNYVFFLEPPDKRNLNAYGFDITSESTRRLAWEKARDTNDFSLSGKLTLVQEIDKEKQFGFLLNLPLYEKAKPISSIDERRENFEGVVNMVFRMKDFMDGIQDKESPYIDISIYDGKISYDNFMYSNKNSLNFQNSYDVIFNKESEINIFGTVWTLSFKGTENLIPYEEVVTGYVIIVVGVIISISCYDFFVWN